MNQSLRATATKGQKTGDGYNLNATNKSLIEQPGTVKDKFHYLLVGAGDPGAGGGPVQECGGRDQPPERLLGVADEEDRGGAREAEDIRERGDREAAEVRRADQQALRAPEEREPEDGERHQGAEGRQDQHRTGPAR